MSLPDRLHTSLSPLPADPLCLCPDGALMVPDGDLSPLPADPLCL